MKKLSLFAAILGTGLLLAPCAGAAPHTTSRPETAMQRAIAFQRNEALAAARQARIEARHPTVSYHDAKSLQAQDSVRRCCSVSDPGSGQWQRDRIH